MIGRQPREWDLNPDGNLPNDAFTCQFCKMSMFAFDKTLSLEVTQRVIRDYAVIQICTSLIKDRQSCEKMYNIYGKQIIDAITESVLHPEYFCEELAPACNESGFKLESGMEGALRILEQKPYKVHDNKFLNNIYKNIQSNKGATPR